MDRIFGSCVMRRFLRFLSAAAAMAACSGGFGLAAEPETHSMPALSAVRRTVRQHFAKLPDFERGDLVTSDQVEPVLSQLESLGWTVADRQPILSQVPAPGEFLAAQLRGSERGVVFMREVGGMPLAYDRLDRLARLPHGKQTVSDLIQKPGGTEMIRYMTASKGGRELGRMLAHAPKGRDFNRPTGRIYTVDQLLARLEESYRRAIEPAPEAPPSDR